MTAGTLVLYGHFGTGNLGNDRTLEAMLQAIAQHRPSARVICVCSGPRVVAAARGVETVPINVSQGHSFRPARSRPLGRVMRTTTRASAELGFWLRWPVWFRSVEQLIVVGTGALDDMAVRRPWHAPYDLFRWCLAAKLGGADIAFLSVGAGPIENRMSRALMLGALRLASYRSYRELPSLEYLRSVGFDTSGDWVYPDLAFSLPETLCREGDRRTGQVRAVGLGVIGYYGWRHDVRCGEGAYQEYVGKLKLFLRWLLDEGYVVRLLQGQSSCDERPVNDLLDFVRRDGPSAWRDRVFAEEIRDNDDLHREIASTDIVVASRFHNVLCALTLGRPVVSIGYHAKNHALLAEMGLGSYCQHIERFSVEHLIEQFKALASEWTEASSRIQARCAEYRLLLAEQYRMILRPEAMESWMRRERCAS